MHRPSRLNGYDDGEDDCFQGAAGLFGDRRTTLQFNGSVCRPGALAR